METVSGIIQIPKVLKSDTEVVVGLGIVPLFFQCGPNELDRAHRLPGLNTQQAHQVVGIGVFRICRKDLSISFRGNSQLSGLVKFPGIA